MIIKIGMTRFELATPATRTRCATKLRYIPTIFMNRNLVSVGALPLCYASLRIHITNPHFVAVVMLVSQNDTQSFCSAECYIQIFLFNVQSDFLILHQKFLLSTIYPTVGLEFLSCLNYIYLEGENYD